MAREVQKTVLDILRNLRGLEPLKQLFWSELNYERVNQPLSHRGWTETAANALAEDPVLFAGGGENNSFHVIYARLASDRLLLGYERPVVSRLQREHPYALFIISNSTQDRWHFLNVKYDEEITKRRLFRRITIGPEERLRTASERVSLLDLTELSDLSPLAIQERHDDAFDVEAVQKDFFKVFADLYHKVAEDIAKVRGLEKEAGKLAQLLLDRMLFLYFIQKKGWLDQKQDYLYLRFQECWKKDPRGNSYYTNVLYPLFICLSNANIKMDDVCAVPFLNGGLFEESARLTQVERLEQARLQIKNSTFKAIFDDLFERFNFTVTEDTPLDVEVAIDPEMLGKIFESLILQLEKDPEKDLRKLTGSYYTPRPIVHFMCQEALKEYLVSQLAGDDGAKGEIFRKRISELLEFPPANQLDDDQVKSLKGLFTPAEAKTLCQAILDCRVCDPAVGSGAFPVGILHEMVAAIARLDLCLQGRDILTHRNYDYDLKKQIIESCLYGVDIQEQAVRLCELRLWLSLIVDYQIDQNKPFEKAIREIPSLPNLSYRIVRGDSLLERLFGHVVQLDQMAKDAKTKQLIESIQADKQSYFREGDTTEKRRLELKILSKQADLAERLIEAKRIAVTKYQTHIFGEEGMTANELKLKAEHEAQIMELDDLKRKVAGAKAELERHTKQKVLVNRGDFDTLRRQYFHTGLHPTFMWRVDFAEVFEERGFDIIITNPPYLNIRHQCQNIPTNERIFLKKQYRSAYKGYDFYVLFLEKSIQLLKGKGIFSYILPNKIQTLGYAKTIREILLNETEILILSDVSNVKIFKEASVYPNVILGKVTQPREDNSIQVGIGFTEVEQIGDQKFYVNLPQNQFLKNPNCCFTISRKFENDIVNKIQMIGKNLGLLCSLSAGTTGFSAVNIGKCLSDNIHPNNLRRTFIVTGNIDRYKINLGNVTYMNNRYENPVLSYNPNFITKGKWNLFCTPKIVIGGMTKVLEAAYDKDGFAVGVSVYCGKEFIIDYRYILGFLNSKLLTFIFRTMFEGKHLAGGYLAINKGDLALLPIPVVDINEPNSKKLSSNLIQSVNNIIGLNKLSLKDDKEAQSILNKIKKEDEEIESIICAICKLTKEEKDIIDEKYDSFFK